MRRVRSLELVPFDPEIERTIRGLRRERRVVEQQATMNNEAANRTLREYGVPSINGTNSSITRPTVQANNFEIKPAIIQMIQTSVQFCGLPSDDPNVHIANFLEICDTFKHNGVSDDAIRLRLFPFSLRDKAKNWLTSLPAGTITTWDELASSDELASKFLAKFFPPAKTAKMRNDITTFSQADMETLYEAWERFKDLLRRCPHHGLPKWLVVQTFYSGLSHPTRITIDAAAGGALMSKSTDEAYDLIEEMAANNYQWPSERTMSKRTAGIHEIEAFTALNAKVDSIYKRLDQLSINVVHSVMQVCELCAGQHVTSECQAGNPFATSSAEQAHYISNPNR